jgi:hypothetical protein
MWFLNNYQFLIVLFAIMSINHNITESCLPQQSQVIDQNLKGIAIMRGNFNNSPIVGMIKFTQQVYKNILKISII